MLFNIRILGKGDHVSRSIDEKKKKAHSYENLISNILWLKSTFCLGWQYWMPKGISLHHCSVTGRGVEVGKIAITSNPCTFVKWKSFIQLFVWLKRSTEDQTLLSRFVWASITPPSATASRWVSYGRRSWPWICHSWTGIFWYLGSLDWHWVCCYHVQHLLFDLFVSCLPVRKVRPLSCCYVTAQKLMPGVTPNFSVEWLEHKSATAWPRSQKDKKDEGKI